MHQKIIVYTDGSLRRTKTKIYCGFGVHFVGDDSLTDISMPFNNGKITNNRAELFAILMALKTVYEKYPEGNVNLTIYTDSEYSMKSITIWILNWKKNGWINKAKKPVENQDLIKAIDQYIMKYGENIKILWVRSHTKKDDPHSLGNQIADTLANEGANRS